MYAFAKAGSPFRGALGNLGVWGPPIPFSSPLPPSYNILSGIFYILFIIVVKGALQFMAQRGPLGCGAPLGPPDICLFEDPALAFAGDDRTLF